MTKENDNVQWGGEMDEVEHEKTYAQFMQVMTWGTVSVSAVILFLIIFIFG